ncbi:hypothetical protein MNBD_GAMMA21-2320 [hydrothermal vent metagenome]|uniref:Uncharacterized protein n=1 Tax=hydrothermal vent metagenome TaxID=652676 RepID=A0A3B1AGV9_9ZZZZ
MYIIQNNTPNNTLSILWLKIKILLLFSKLSSMVIKSVNFLLTHKEKGSDNILYKIKSSIYSITAEYINTVIYKNINVAVYAQYRIHRDST